MWGDEVVPCEVIPTELADAVERKALAYDRERLRHDETLDALSVASRQLYETRGELRAVRSELELARDALADRTPTWVWWTVVGVSSGVALGAGLYAGIRLF